MSTFWKINIILSITVFLIFIGQLLNMAFVKVDFPFQDFFSLIFLYGPFLEIIQVPICIGYSLITKRDKKGYKYIFMMIGFFVIKIALYVGIMSAAVIRNT